MAKEQLSYQERQSKFGELCSRLEVRGTAPTPSELRTLAEYSPMLDSAFTTKTAHFWELHDLSSKIIQLTGPQNDPFSEPLTPREVTRELRVLIAQFDTDPILFDALVDALAKIVSLEPFTDDALPMLHPMLRQWLASYLRGQIEKPHARRSKEKSNRNHFERSICVFIAHMKRLGASPTSNITSGTYSICQAVADAYANSLDWQDQKSCPEAEGLANIWSNRSYYLPDRSLE